MKVPAPADTQCRERGLQVGTRPPRLDLAEFHARRTGNSRRGCPCFPAGGPRPVQQDGGNGRCHGGADRDQGDRPARHADVDNFDRDRLARAGRVISPPSGGMGLKTAAEAAGMMAAAASRPQMTAAAATASRRSRLAGLGAGARDEIPGGEGV